MRVPQTVVTTVTAVALVLGLAGCIQNSPGLPDESSSPSVESPTPTLVAPSASPTTSGLSESDYDNIAASIDSGNTAALEGYLADSVIVIYAASECCGAQSPVEAIGSLDYLNNATGPWTFPTPAATVDSYRTGFYTDYFPAGSFVGRSSDPDPFVISFTVTGDRITTIFISAAESLLLP